MLKRSGYGRTGDRPNYVKVKAMNEDMEEVIYEGTELLQEHSAMR